MLADLSEAIGELTSLKELILKGSGITSRSSSIGRLNNLAVLDLRKTNITSIPSSAGCLNNLEYLYLGEMKMSDLRYLNLESTGMLVNLSEAIRNLASLEMLGVKRSGITSLSSPIGRLSTLTDLYLDHTMESVNLPEEMFDLTGLNILRRKDSRILDQYLEKLLARPQPQKAFAKSPNLWPLALKNATRVFKIPTFWRRYVRERKVLRKNEKAECY